MTGLVTLVPDLRSQVARSSCDTLALLAAEVGDHAVLDRPMREQVLPALISLASNGNKVLASAGRECLPTLVMYCHFESMLKVLAGTLGESRHATVRHVCCVCLVHALQYWPMEVLGGVAALLGHSRPGRDRARSGARRAQCLVPTRPPSPNGQLLSTSDRTRRHVGCSGGREDRLRRRGEGRALCPPAGPARRPGAAAADRPPSRPAWRVPRPFSGLPASRPAPVPVTAGGGRQHVVRGVPRLPQLSSRRTQRARRCRGVPSGGALRSRRGSGGRRRRRCGGAVPSATSAGLAARARLAAAFSRGRGWLVARSPMLDGEPLISEAMGRRPEMQSPIEMREPLRLLSRSPRQNQHAASRRAGSPPLRRRPAHAEVPGVRPGMQSAA